MIRRHRALAFGLAVFAPAAARAADVERLAGELSELEERARKLDAVVATAPRSAAVAAEHRLVDAQVLHNLQDYVRAAILLMDIVERFPNSPVFDEAQFYLAENLFQMGENRSARAYYLKVAGNPSHKHFQDALQRLVEVSLRLGESSGLQELMAQLGGIPPERLSPSVPYVRGKVHYFHGTPDDAIAAFAQVPDGSPYARQARYFTGASLVKKKDLPKAIETFEALLALPAQDDKARRVHEMTQLALGRLYYETGELPKAIDRYQQVPRTSPLFDAALYEVAWVHIKAGDMQRALRALDLLLLSHPDSPMAPEIHVLEANLLIRLADHAKATDVFSRTRERYEPAYVQLDQSLRADPDPARFLDALVGRGAGATEIAMAVPPLALDWARQTPAIAQIARASGGMEAIQADLAECEQLLERLDRGVNGPARARIFPDLAIGRGHALEVENNLVHLRDRLAKAERDLVWSKASEDERKQLHAVAEERKALEDEVRKLPRSRAGYDERARASAEEYLALDKRVAEISVVLDSLRAQLVAADKYLNDTRQGTPDDTARIQQFVAEAAPLRGAIDEIERELQAMRGEIADAQQSVGVGDPRTLQEQEVKRRYGEVLAREHQLVATLADRVSGGDRAKLGRLAELVARAQALQATIEEFNARLDRQIDERLGEIKGTLADERAKVGAYRQEQEAHRAEHGAVGGETALATLRHVQRRFYDIVVQSDVGILDVAWALKQQKTESVNTLVKDRKNELKALDEDFRGVFGEAAP